MKKFVENKLLADLRLPVKHLNLNDFIIDFDQQSNEIGNKLIENYNKRMFNVNYYYFFFIFFLLSKI